MITFKERVCVLIILFCMGVFVFNNAHKHNQVNGETVIGGDTITTEVLTDTMADYFDSQFVLPYLQEDEDEVTEEYIRSLPLTKENIMLAMEFYEIDKPEIVYAQAVLETGYFKSYACKHGNNLFGLQGNSPLYKFNHWSESVKSYKTMIQNKWDGREHLFDNYYAFLNDMSANPKRFAPMRYAEDKQYTAKLKTIVMREELNEVETNDDYAIFASI